MASPRLRVMKGAFLVRPHARGFPAYAQTPLSEYVRLREHDLTRESHERLLTGTRISSLRTTPEKERSSKEYLKKLHLAKESIAGKLAKVASENDEFFQMLQKRKYLFVDPSGGVTFTRVNLRWGYIRIPCDDIRWLISHV